MSFSPNMKKLRAIAVTLALVVATNFAISKAESVKYFPFGKQAPVVTRTADVRVNLSLPGQGITSGETSLPTAPRPVASGETSLPPAPKPIIMLTSGETSYPTAPKPTM